MGVYAIKDLEKLTGIKAHTLRIWEQRYELIVPNRTNTNIRFYDDEQLRKLLNIALLNRNGYKISHIAKMPMEEIQEVVQNLNEIDPQTSQSDALTIAMIDMDEQRFFNIIDARTDAIGFEQMMLQTIFPFLDKLYLLWLTGSINGAHENFISNLIRQKIIGAIDKMKPNNQDNKKFLLYLPEGEMHELSLLFMYYLLRVRSFQVIYLGQNISINDVGFTVRAHKPDYVFTMISEAYIKKPIQVYINELEKSCPNTTLLLSGYQIAVQGIQSTNRIEVLNTLPATIDFINSVGQKSNINSRMRV